MLEGIFELEIGNSDQENAKLSVRGLWLQNQIYKTQYQRGHFAKILDHINELITDIGMPAKDDPERVPIEYLYYKYEYMRAKVFLKMRLFTKADYLCQ